MTDLVWVYDVPVPRHVKLPWIACLERDGATTRIYLSAHVPYEAITIIWDRLTPDERRQWTDKAHTPPPPDPFH